MTDERKILIISLDGGSWNVLRPLLAQGRLPHLRKLMNRGASGALQSTYPPLTPPAWVTFQTGVEPSVHGVFAFTEVSEEGWPTRRIVSSESIGCQTMWERFGQQGRRVLLVDVPLSYPFRDFEGCQVSDVFIPYNTPGAGGWTSPASLGPELDHLVGGWKFIKGPEMRGQADEESVRRFVSQMIDFVRQRQTAAGHLLQTQEWDVCMVHLHAVDVLQHAVWGYLLEDHPFYRADLHDVAAAFYEAVDAAVGSLIEQVPASTLVLVASDHGFRSHRKVLNLNAWLYQQGWLRLPWKVEVRKRVSRNAGLRQVALAFGKLGMARAAALAKYRDSYEYDGEATQAASTAGPWQTQFGLITLHKSLSPEQKRKVSELIRTGLLAVRDPDTHDPVVAEVRDAADVYRRRTSQACPDLVVVPAENYSIDPGLPTQTLFLTIKESSYHIGTHALQGICIWAGSTVQHREDVAASLLDVAPTLLHYLGLPVPAYMEGRVLADLFTGDPVMSRPVVISDESGEHTVTRTTSAEEQAIVEQRLRSLGYL